MFKLDLPRVASGGAAGMSEAPSSSLTYMSSSIGSSKISVALALPLRLDVAVEGPADAVLESARVAVPFRAFWPFLVLGLQPRMKGFLSSSFMNEADV
jgi:hypothetical protein